MGLACLLGVVLLLLSFARLIGDTQSAAFSVGIAKGALSAPLWQTRLGLNIALFVLALLALHLAFGLACWALAVISGRAFPGARCSRGQWILAWYLPGLAWLLVANASLYPHSSLGEPYGGIGSTRIMGLSPLAIGTCLLLAACAVVGLTALLRVARSRSTWAIAGAVVVAIVSGFTWKQVSHGAPPSDMPNIIFLGIDSLRPDVVATGHAPHVRAFMEDAVQFTDAITPLARTFPSWVSVLTGRHPHTTGAYMNLLPPSLIHTGTTLPQLLRQHGYRAYYAIDETRFSNIDASYGFDRTATPAIGGSDFVLTWFGDTPLSNLVANTSLGALLFPQLHANRAAHRIYDPDTFVERVEREFRYDEPLFLAVHLTLPHWPYSWSTSPPSELTKENIGDAYLQTVRRADQQFGDLLAMLEGTGALDNALVFVLSDHGEALGDTNDFMSGAFPDLDDSAANAHRYGHGTSVFSPHQYHVVLGARSFGQAKPLVGKSGLRGEPVTLLDLAPTVLELLNIDTGEQIDGRSLVPLLRPTGVAADFTDRIRFTESEYNPQGFNADSFSPSALASAARIYRLDPDTDRITVRPDKIDWIMSTRQYAALSGDAFAGAVPDAGDGNYRLVFQPGSGKDSSRDRARLRQALEQRFGIRFTTETLLAPGPG